MLKLCKCSSPLVGWLSLGELKCGSGDLLEITVIEAFAVVDISKHFNTGPNGHSPYLVPSPECQPGPAVSVTLSDRLAV